MMVARVNAWHTFVRFLSLSLFLELSPSHVHLTARKTREKRKENVTSLCSEGRTLERERENNLE